MTESVLWEIEQLDTDDRRGRVTVIFAEKAIRNKQAQMNMSDRLKGSFDDKVLWSKEGPPARESVAQLREQLSRKFLVTTPSEFEKDAVICFSHKKYISSRLGVLADWRH